MESPHSLTAFFCTLISLLSGMFAAILNNIEIFTRIGAGTVAMLSGLMAIRYYHYASLEKKEAIKKLKEQ